MIAIIYEFNWVQYVSATTYAKLREENKTLKDNVEFLHSCLDDRDKSIAIMQEENKKLKKENEELKEYKLMYEWLC